MTPSSTAKASNPVPAVPLTVAVSDASSRTRGKRSDRVAAEIRPYLVAAFDAAREAATVTSDSQGACNFDAATLSFDKGVLTFEQIKALFKNAGLEGTLMHRGTRRWSVEPPVRAMAMRRTAQAEAMRDALKGCPYVKVGIDYITD